MDTIKEQALKIMEISRGNICNRCLGRNFYPALSGADNYERGHFLKQTMKVEDTPSKKQFTCYVCGDIFNSLEKFLDQILDKINDSEIEFSTFLLGCRLPAEILEKEIKIQEAVEIDGESIKKEINRELGKNLSLQLSKEVDFDNPNLVVMVDFTRNQVELQINPLFIEGRYRKLIRGIPQTRWPCKKCKGRGCERCGYTGKMYQESVEELVAEEVLALTRGQESKFHGAGREDIDVRMLGRGRPFVLEIKEPKVRDLNLKDLEDKINQHSQGKIEVLDLKMVGKERRSAIKLSSRETYKIYQALIELDEEVVNEDLEILNSLNIIKQRTPIRVSHRRADKIRIREVKEIVTKKLDSKHLELIVNCEGGLYIKELISGDEDRTQPSVSSLLGIKALCVDLDVLEVNI
jgi:tRNA pseudouridine synthase 10